ncbi:hypothetical protein PROFUN_07070 [Planoprotostelium fungivorum]|uniref:Endonuclease/exonuclease/phosphatase domain-containing protein n=1 Tax=Planoprotostelium fungivorum TaxID=1890364 RepID=A0A2P6NN49_9EUKA|nr:hypothetical protein PROFUN_07070 [Planoprotostelium fungivorum]
MSGRDEETNGKDKEQSGDKRDEELKTKSSMKLTTKKEDNHTREDWGRQRKERRGLQKCTVDTRKHNRILRQDFQEAGDFNEIISASDCRATYIQKKKKGPLHKLLQQRGMINSAILLNTREKHTYVQTNNKGKSFSRLDYVYISNDLSKQTLSYNIDYSAMTLSDHFLIWIMSQS